MPYGYHGKILHVNLSTGKMEVETPPESFYRTYMGGSAMATLELPVPLTDAPAPWGRGTCHGHATWFFSLWPPFLGRCLIRCL